MSEHMEVAAAGAAAVDTVPLPGADVTSLLLTAAPEAPAGPPLPDKLVEGYIDAVNGYKVSGWAWCRSLPLFAVEVEIRIGDRFAAVVRADLLRPDLAKAGLGDGRHGFSVVLDNPVADDARESVSAFVCCGPNGGKTALINRSIRPAVPVPPAAPVEARSLPVPAAPAAITEKQLEWLGKQLEAGIAAVASGAAKESSRLAVELRGLREDISRTAGADDVRAVQEGVAGLSARTELLQLRLDEVLAAIAGDAARPPAGAREKGLIFVVAVLSMISLSALVLGLVAVLL